MPSGCAPALKQRESIQAWKAEVKDHQRVVFGLPSEQGILAVGSHIHQVASSLKGPRNVCGDALIILGQQKAHQSSTFRMRPVAASTSTSRRRPRGVRTLIS